MQGKEKTPKTCFGDLTWLCCGFKSLEGFLLYHVNISAARLWQRKREKSPRHFLCPAHGCSLGLVPLEAELCVSAIVSQRNCRLTNVTLLHVPAENKTKSTFRMTGVTARSRSQATAAYLAAPEESLSSNPLVLFLRGFNGTTESRNTTHTNIWIPECSSDGFRSL